VRAEGRRGGGGDFDGGLVAVGRQTHLLNEQRQLQWYGVQQLILHSRCSSGPLGSPAYSVHMF